MQDGLMRRELPAGTVTLLFTDIEGSTKLLHELGPDGYARALSEHREILRGAFAGHGGVEVDTEGDAFFVAFPSASEAVMAAREAQHRLASGRIRVRMGLHTGTPHVTDEGYVGVDVHKGARIGAAGHGGQVLLSKETRTLIEADVTDLGEHRLKDFAEPVWLFQLGAERFPPLKTISNTNLPKPVSSFVGRTRELDAVLASVRSGARLLTLTGPGGSGKTRLAIEAASELVSEFPNGVFWVGLAALRDPTLVVATIAQTLGAKDGLAEHIGERAMLLLLDNLEQVIEAAPTLSSLAASCPNLTLLVTSRELLRVAGEIGYPVPPLAEIDAVDLFCARARLQPTDTIAELCRRLDDLPLAVELAAGRASVLSPNQILERLSKRLDLLRGGRDAEARQRTLRSTIEWSYDLLHEDEKKLFASLAVFAGGCTLDAAEDVAEAGIDDLQSLVDKNLLRHTDDRFWMLETIREYAVERLAESGESEELRRRHAEHFLTLAEEAEPYLRIEAREWVDRLEREHDNIRAALDLFDAWGESDRALRLGAAVWNFWSLRGHIREGLDRLERALRGDLRPTAVRANGLAGAADLAIDANDGVLARRRAGEALELHRAHHNTWGVAHCLLVIGLTHMFVGEWPEGERCFDESVRLFEELGDEHSAQLAIRRLAWSYEAQGDRARARALNEENLRRARATRHELIEAQTLALLAGYAMNEGRLDEAVPMLTEAHRIHRDRPDYVDRYWGTVVVCRFARALALVGSAATAARVLSCAEALFEDMGATQESWLKKINEETLTLTRRQLDEAAFAEASEQGRKLTADQAVALALNSLDVSLKHNRGPAHADP